VASGREIINDLAAELKSYVLPVPVKC